MSSITLRRAIPGDAGRISKVLHDSFLQFKEFYTDKAFAATTVGKSEVLQRMKEGCVWVALKDKNVIGTVAIIKKGEDLYIRGMAVLPEARGLHAGWKLLKEVEKYAAENNFKSLLLSTTPYLPAAVHLYKKFGFEHIGEMDNSFYGTLIFQMRKNL